MEQLSPSQQRLVEVWQQHTYSEFALKDVPRTLETMTANPYVLCVPVGAGGRGVAGVKRFYAEEFFPGIASDTKLTPVATTVTENRIVEEMVISFTHDVTMPWILPGIAPTGKTVEFGFVGVIGFEGDKISYERLYWDQATLLVQLGILDPKLVPAAFGADCARLLADPTRLRDH